MGATRSHSWDTPRRVRDLLDREKRRLSIEFEERLSFEVRSHAEEQAEAARADKIRAMERFARSVAHDFNNVLQAVKAASALIERHAGDAEKVARFARLLDEAVARGGAAANRLLTLIGRGELHAAPVDVAAVLAEAKETLAEATMAEAASARVAFVVEAADDLPAALVDATQLKTAVLGLALNGYEAISGAGKVTLSAGAYKAPRGRGFQGDDWIFITITDTGKGMDAELVARAREPFFTTKSASHSMGLGLSLASAFAEQSGGALTIETARGRGATVTLRLPAATAAEAEPEEAPEPKRHRRRKARILLVDDENGVREAIAAELADHGFTVLQAPSGAAALALLGDSGKIDLVIADLSMPAMDGLTFIHKVLETRAGLAAILLTGNVGDNFVMQRKRSSDGAVTLCRKPIGGAELAAKAWSLIESDGAGSA